MVFKEGQKSRDIVLCPFLQVQYHELKELELLGTTSKSKDVADSGTFTYLKLLLLLLLLLP
jgi:hypothetical protein